MRRGEARRFAEATLCLPLFLRDSPRGPLLRRARGAPASVRGARERAACPPGRKEGRKEGRPGLELRAKGKKKNNKRPRGGEGRVVLFFLSFFFLFPLFPFMVVFFLYEAVGTTEVTE